MLGLMISETEQKELEYLLKKEMDELLFEVTADDFNAEIKNAIKKRYITLFNLYKRFASQNELVNYTPRKNFPHVK
ncbi:hypothetical protein FPQ13_07905 [Allobacillus salarius]|uniref:Uncharacterized protein n=1 Tax=Allobacillus salarius TaxID=1955272 RepID=A0A556PLH9_9BACI|nr:hypothetical protein FPQ13_07905 [Allobacillus salarius]